jgi:hypothetical protein
MYIVPQIWLIIQGILEVSSSVSSECLVYGMVCRKPIMLIYSARCIEWSYKRANYRRVGGGLTYWVQDGIYPVMKEAIAYSNKDVPPREVNNGKIMLVFSQLKDTSISKNI